MQPMPPSCEEDGTDNKMDDSLAREGSFSRMLALSEPEHSPLSAPTQPTPPPRPHRLQACDVSISPVLPKPTHQQDERREPARKSASFHGVRRRPRICSLRVWSGPASIQSTPTVSFPGNGEARIKGEHARESNVFQKPSPDSASGSASGRWSTGSPPSGVMPQPIRNESMGKGKSGRVPRTCGDREWGWSASQSSTSLPGKPLPIRRKRKSPEWSQEHPVAGAEMLTGGSISPASHDNPDWFGGN